MSCLNCARLMVALDEARAEAAAWKAYQAVDVDHVRYVRWRDRLAMPPKMTMIAMALLDANGRPMSRSALFAVMQDSPRADHAFDDPSEKLVDNYLCRLRVVMRNLGCADGGLRTHWGIGWSMTPLGQDALADAAGEGRKQVAA